MAETRYKNASVRFFSEGQGPAVVLLHGFLEDLSMWKGILPALSEGHQVIRIDLLGHGKTDNTGSIASMEEQAEMVQTVLSELGTRHYSLIGHSMGGYVALAMTEMYPDQVRGLCLMNSTSFADTSEKKINRDRAIHAVRQNHRSFARIAIPGLFAPSNRVKFAKEIKELTEISLKMKPQGIIGSLEGMKIRKDRSSIFKKSQVPKLLIIGEQDPALELDTLIPQAQYKGVRAVSFTDGHMSHIENQSELTESLLQFLEEINSGSQNEK